MVYREICSYSSNGWFLSDFYAFDYILKGRGATQMWLAAVHRQDIVDEYGSLIQGQQEGNSIIVDYSSTR